MNINLALIDNDKLYIKRFVSAFEEFFPQIEIYSFSDVDVAVQSLYIRPVDILLVSENVYHSAKEKIAHISCKAAVILLNTKGISRLDDFFAVCKYQRIDHLNQAIMTIYSELSNIVIDEGAGLGAVRLFTFMSGAGGSGCSTAAAAYACYLAMYKKQKVLYLDLNTFGMPDMFFSDSGNYTMTDCITAIMNQKPNLGVQLKNFARRDHSGVFYFASCVNALDWFDMDDETLLTMIKSLAATGSFDRIIIDSVPGWNRVSAYLADNSNSLYLVSEGTAASNIKTERLWETAATYYHSQKKDTSKLYVIYCCYNSASQKIRDDKIRELVSLPFISDHKGSHDLVRKLSAQSYWGA